MQFAGKFKIFRDRARCTSNDRYFNRGHAKKFLSVGACYGHIATTYPDVVFFTYDHSDGECWKCTDQSSPYHTISKHWTTYQRLDVGSNVEA